MKKKIKLTNREVCELYNALTMLDGYQVVCSERVVDTPYEIEPNARLEIGLNKRLLRDRKDAIEEAHNGIVTVLSKGTGRVAEMVRDKTGEMVFNPAFADYQMRYKELLSKSSEFTLYVISIKDIHVGVKSDPKSNPIPASVIEHLHPILSQLPE